MALHARLLRLLLPLPLFILPAASHAVEEPEFEVIRKLDSAVELRMYAPYVVAEVVLDSTAEEAGSRAFPILAGYIFGKNKGERKLAMTAPVTQSAVPARLQMPVPLMPSGQAAAAGSMRVQFVLPRGTTLDNAPAPLDSRVQLRAVPGSAWATIRYSGTWSQANYSEHLSALRVALDAAGIATTGEPVLARYDAPFTPWFMRRNEIWLALS